MFLPHLPKEFKKDEDLNQETPSKSKSRSKEDRREREKGRRSEDGDRKTGRSRESDDKTPKSGSISPSRQVSETTFPHDTLYRGVDL